MLRKGALMQREKERAIPGAFPGMLEWGEMARKCHRCNGAMIEQKFYGPGEPFWGLKCLFCGEILDPLIRENRNLSKGLEIVNSHGLRNGRERRR